MKAAIFGLVISVFAVAIFLGYRALPEVREVKEASMLKFLHFYLLEYGSSHQHFPQSIEAAFQDGLLDDFPEDRIEYLESAVEEGRIHYSLSKEGGYTLTLMTCRNRKITLVGFSEVIHKKPNKPAHTITDPP